MKKNKIFIYIGLVGLIAFEYSKLPINKTESNVIYYERLPLVEGFKTPDNYYDVNEMSLSVTKMIFPDYTIVDSGWPEYNSNQISYEMREFSDSTWFYLRASSIGSNDTVRMSILDYRQDLTHFILDPEIFTIRANYKISEDKIISNYYYEDEDGDICINVNILCAIMITYINALFTYLFWC